MTDNVGLCLSFNIPYSFSSCEMCFEIIFKLELEAAHNQMLFRCYRMMDLLRQHKIW